MRVGVLWASSRNSSNLLVTLPTRERMMKSVFVVIIALSMLSPRLKWYCVPNRQVFTSKFSRSTIFACIDLVEAFYQIPRHFERHPENSQYHHFRFVWVHSDAFWKNAAQTFQGFIDEIMWVLLFCFATLRTYSWWRKPTFLPSPIFHLPGTLWHPDKLG